MIKCRTGKTKERQNTIRIVNNSWIIKPNVTKRRVIKMFVISSIAKQFPLKRN